MTTTGDLIVHTEEALGYRPSGAVVVLTLTDDNVPHSVYELPPHPTEHVLTAVRGHRLVVLSYENDPGESTDTVRALASAPDNTVLDTVTIWTDLWQSEVHGIGVIGDRPFDRTRAELADLVVNDPSSSRLISEARSSTTEDHVGAWLSILEHGLAGADTTTIARAIAGLNNHPCWLWLRGFHGETCQHYGCVPGGRVSGLIFSEIAGMMTDESSAGALVTACLANYDDGRIVAFRAALGRLRAIAPFNPHVLALARTSQRLGRFLVAGQPGSMGPAL